jgi:hypothetical protein
VLLRTSKVDAIKLALANLSQLITKGILLSGACQPEYISNRLNEIKPGMMEEATKNARIAGEQFSRNSQTKPGKLNRAAQGWFRIENRDAATPECKVVRVVVDVEYEVHCQSTPARFSVRKSNKAKEHTSQTVCRNAFSHSSFSCLPWFALG